MYVYNILRFRMNTDYLYEHMERKHVDVRLPMCMRAFVLPNPFGTDDHPDERICMPYDSNEHIGSADLSIQHAKNACIRNVAKHTYEQQLSIILNKYPPPIRKLSVGRKTGIIFIINHMLFVNA